jgi:hypothetical protein
MITHVILAVVWLLVVLATVCGGVCCVLFGADLQQQLGGSVICFALAAMCARFTVNDVKWILNNRK